MIGVFLDPHPEEVVYSNIARNAVALSYPNLRSVGMAYFGNPQTIATIAFPSRLEYLVTHLPSGAKHTVDSLIDYHSLLPFFAPFLPAERVAQLRDGMRGAGGMGMHMRTGIMASKVPLPEVLRICPACAEEDRRQYGEWFWHRQHQLSGIYVCSKHLIWLEKSSVQLTNRQTRHGYVSAESAITNLSSTRSISRSPLEDTLLAIAQFSHYVFEHRPVPLGLDLLQERYLRTLAKNDLATFTGRVRMSEVQEAFIAFYSQEVLTFLHCQLDIHSPDNWLARLLRKPDSALHPIHHFLLMRFLGGDAGGYLLNQLEPCGPFGNGPWPCLNPICEHYGKYVIKICSVSYPPGLNGKPSGSFACMCGFTYGRVGPDTKSEDAYRRGKIISVGGAWESALQQYWTDSSLSVNEIARRLGVDPMTAKRHALRLKLSMVRTKQGRELVVPSPAQRPLKANSSVETQALRLTMHKAWQETCKEQGHHGTKYIRQQIPQVYAWLYRYDRNWLKQNLPFKKQSTHPPRIDWGVRDSEISQLIPEAIRHVLTRPGPPRRITIAAIDRDVGHLAMIQQHLDLLPLTAIALAEAEESRKAFAIRRIQWFSKHWPDQDQPPKYWELVRLSGVSRLLPDVDIQLALDNTINEINRLN